MTDDLDETLIRRAEVLDANGDVIVVPISTHNDWDSRSIPMGHLKTDRDNISYALVDYVMIISSRRAHRPIQQLAAGTVQTIKELIRHLPH